MTDNEKAATFIGWKPREAQAGPEFIEAPDMADPRNYMKALEALATREIHGAVSTTLFAKEGRRFSCVLTRLDSEGSDEDFIRYAASFGEAAVLSLAALYDMEHPKAN